MANVLALPFRTTQLIPDFADSVVHHICDADPNTHPDTVKADAEGLAAQRKKLFGTGAPLELQETVVTALLAYYAQLSYALTKLSDNISVSFPWHPIFNASTSAFLGGFPSPSPVSLQSLQYERASVLFNVAALYSALGAQTKRTDQDGIKSSLISFQKAAGALTHLLTLVSLIDQLPSAFSPPSPEFSLKSLEAMRDVCLAQAQEAFWQKAVMDRLKNGTIAKLAAKVSEFYEAAVTEAMEAKGNPETWPAFAFPQALLNHLAIKQLHFAAVAQFRKSIDDSGANRYGDELGRLNIALGFVRKAVDGSKRGVAESVVRDLKGLQAIIEENLARAEKDNRLIYLEAVTPLSALTSIVSASMVKPIVQPELLSPLDFLHSRPGGLGKPYFEQLVPKAVSLAIRLYQDRKEAFLREDLVEKKEELDVMANSCLEPLGLPGSIQAILQPVGLPPSLLTQAQEVRAAGGTARIKSMMQDIRRVAQVNQQILNEALEVLIREEVEDEHHRRQFGTDRWTRPASASANVHLTGRAESLGATLQAASTSDGVVRAKFAEWESNIAVLASDPSEIEAAIPSFAAPSLNSKQSFTLKNLRQALQELDDIRALRDRIIQDAKLAGAVNDIRSRVVRHASQLASSSSRSSSTGAEDYEELMEEEMAKFSKFKMAMNVNESRQDDALDQIKTANTAFIQSRRSDPLLRAREKALQALDVAYQKHHELATNLAEGLKFYSDVAKLLNELRDSCKQWAYARQVESRDQIQNLTSGLESMRLSVTPGAYDPSRHGPIRFG